MATEGYKDGGLYLIRMMVVFATMYRPDLSANFRAANWWRVWQILLAVIGDIRTLLDSVTIDQVRQRVTGNSFW